MGKKIHGAVAGWFDHGSFCIEDSVARISLAGTHMRWSLCGTVLQRYCLAVKK